MTALSAIVTGSGSGIGRACAHALAQRGLSVILVDRDRSSLQEAIDTLPSKNNLKHHILALDVTDHDAVKKAFAEFTHNDQNDSRITSLINCAGITRDQFLLKMPLQNWDDVMNVNLKGVFNMTQAFGRYVASKNETEQRVPSAIVNISSIIGKTGNLGQANYAASKAGVIGFTKSAAKELAREGIRVNAIMPGFISTPMAAAVPEKVMAGVVKQIPAGRMGAPEEVAAAASFLLSNDASYITGACLEVTGGLYM